MKKLLVLLLFAAPAFGQATAERWSEDVLPVPAANDVRDAGRRDAVSASEFATRCAARGGVADGANVGFGQFREVVPLPAKNAFRVKTRTGPVATGGSLWMGPPAVPVAVPTSTATAALRALVGVICGRGPSEEMSRIHARGGVAVVANKKAIRYWATKQSPRESVCVRLHPVDAHGPIPGSDAVPGPKPAPICDLDFRHEASEELRIGAGECGRILGSHRGPPQKVPWSGPVETFAASRRAALHFTPKENA